MWIFGLHDGFPESEVNTPLPLRKGINSKPHSKIQVQRELYDTLIVATLQNLLRQIVLRKPTKNRRVLVAKKGRNVLIYQCSGTRLRGSTPRLAGLP